MINFNAVVQSARTRRHSLLSAFEKVIRRGIFLNGPENKKLEQLLRAILGQGMVTTVASGHDALLFALAALKLQSKDEVVFPVNAYPTAFPVVLSGVTPVPVDVDQNGQLDPLALKKAITKKTKVIIVVHLFGSVGSLQEIQRLCRQHKLILIEDCAQAFGSTYQKKPVGTFGDISCFSFYPTKNLGALGDGGAIWTKNKQLFDFFTAAKSYGEKNRYESNFVAGHSRLPELQAAGLRIYVKHINKEIELRQKVFGWYKNSLRWVRLLESDQRSIPAPHLLVIEADTRDALQKFLKARGIETFVHYPHPVHLVPAFRFLKYPKGSFPVAERLASRILSLPFHPSMKKSEVFSIVQTIKTFYGKTNS